MNVLILGANSDIARALAAQFAGQEKADLYLASRDLELLTKRARDLEIRYQVKARLLFFEATDYASHRDFYQGLDPKPEVVVLAFGYLGDQQRGQEDFEEARRIIDVNLLAAVSILEIAARDLEARGRGCIIGLGSPAGDRGRRSNYFYGAAKGGLSVYLSGLRSRLYPRGVRVLTVLPGFVRTKMTEGLELPEPLVATPEQVAADIYAAYRRGRDFLYTRWFWKWIMLIIKMMPERIFKRLSL